MSTKVFIQASTCEARANEIARAILHDFPLTSNSDLPISVYGVPKGGMLPAAMVVSALRRMGQRHAVQVFTPTAVMVIVDDVVDSGKTREQFVDNDAMFYALFDKTSTADTEFRGQWLVFPWEVEEGEDKSADDAVVRMIQHIGDDPDREGLLETPKRVVKAWDSWFSGYKQDPKEVLKVFKDGAHGYDQMVLETDIPVYSTCEHHMASIFGVAHVAYIPDGAVVGLSKLVRVVDGFARRLQVQERLTTQIADCLNKELKPLGVGVVLQCRHLCMESRGVSKPGVVTTTSALRGAIKTEDSARAEFMSLVHSSRRSNNGIL